MPKHCDVIPRLDSEGWMLHFVAIREEEAHKNIGTHIFHPDCDRITSTKHQGDAR